MTDDIYDLADWPRFRWNHERLAEQLAEVRYRQGRLMGRWRAVASVCAAKPFFEP